MKILPATVQLDPRDLYVRMPFPPGEFAALCTALQETAPELRALARYRKHQKLKDKANDLAKRCEQWASTASVSHEADGTTHLYLCDLEDDDSLYRFDSLLYDASKELNALVKYRKHVKAKAKAKAIAAVLDRWQEATETVPEYDPRTIAA